MSKVIHGIHLNGDVVNNEDEGMCVVNMRSIFIVNLMYYYLSIPYVPFYKTILQKLRA